MLKTGNSLKRGKGIAIRKEILKRRKEKNQFRIWAGWGRHFFYVDKQSGVLMAVGQNDKGQLSIGNDIKNRYKPEKVNFFEKKLVNDISTGPDFSLFTSKDGTYACGNNADWQCAVGHQANNVFVASKVVFSGSPDAKGSVFKAGCENYDERDVPRSKKGTAWKIDVEDVVDVTTGLIWVMFLTFNGEIFALGSNYGQFGSGNEANVLDKIEVTYFKKKEIQIHSILSVDSTSFFLSKEKQVYTAGMNDVGQFGDNNPLVPHRNTPKLVKSLCNFDLFGSGNTDRFMVFKKNKKIFGFGLNSPDTVSTSIETGVSYYGIKEKMSRSPIEIPKIRAESVVKILTSNHATFLIYDNDKIYGVGDPFKLMIWGDLKVPLSNEFMELPILVRREKTDRDYLAKEDRLEFLRKFLGNVDADFFSFFRTLS